MVIARSRSRSIESSSCSRMSREATVWVISRMRSARVDFPWSMWAMIEKLRMRLWSDKRPPRIEGALDPLRRDRRDRERAVGEEAVAVEGDRPAQRLRPAIGRQIEAPRGHAARAPPRLSGNRHAALAVDRPRHERLGAEAQLDVDLVV